MELIKWNTGLKQELIRICSSVDRRYLSERMPDPYTEQAADWWLEMVAEHDGKDGIFRAITVDGRIEGNISIEQKTDVYRKDAEIGYMLLTEYWSRGIMTEAVREICETAFSELDIIRITGLVYAPNKPSARVLEKNGFVPEGIMKNAVYKNGTVCDLLLYGKLAEK